MANPLTDEKLEAAREWGALDIVSWFTDNVADSHVTVADLVAEIDRLREAMGKVPHLAFAMRLERVEATDPMHSETQCIRLGGACALAARSESASAIRSRMDPTKGAS